MIKYVHTNIISLDWKALADFYVNVFECRIKLPVRNQSAQWLEQGTGVKNAALKGAHLILPGYEENGPTLEIYQYSDTLPSPPMHSNSKGFGHIAFVVSDVKAILNELIEHGGSELGKITRTEISGVGILEFVYARDPDGNIIEIQSWHRN